MYLVVHVAILFGGIFDSWVLGAPTSIKREQAGPCVGMDCLHGVLMHDDDKDGTAHQNEHMMEKIQDEMKPKEQFGPCQGQDCDHVEHQPAVNEDILPEAVGKQGPQDAMEAHHGVLMHGDTDSGKAHQLSDTMDQQRNQKVDNSEQGPKDAMENMHGVLMHGDGTQGQGHDQEHADLSKDDGKPSDSSVGLPEEMLGLSGKELETEKNNEDENYVKWQREQGKPVEGGTGAKRKHPPMFFSFDTIKDTIYDNVEQLKLRYLNKLKTDEKKDEEEARAEKLRDLKNKAADINPERNVHDIKLRRTGSNGDEF